MATPRDAGAPSHGGGVAALAAALGLALMPWQRRVAEVALEVDECGVYRYDTVVLTVPRQSGKTTLMRAVMIHRALRVARANVFLTAQLREDARDLWSDTVALVRDSPLAPLVESVRLTNGSETLSLAGGSRLRLFNPGSDKALHGKTSDLVVIDEAFAFDDARGAAILQAVVPSQATRRGAQTWIVSTAGTAASGFLRGFVERGRASVGNPTDNSRLAYFEWSIPEDADTTDLAVYAAHHPALGHTITARALESAYATMGAAEFARAYGNYWTSTASWALSPALWEAARTTEPFAVGCPLAFAAEVAADRSGGVIVAAGRLADGRAAIEVIETRGGIGWIAPRLLELSDTHRPVAVVVDPYGPARPVYASLAESHRCPALWTGFGTGDLVAAHTELLDGLASARLVHRSHERLDAAVRAASLRVVREVEVFSRNHDGQGNSPAALIAAMLAAYGLAHPPDATPAAVLRVVG